MDGDEPPSKRQRAAAGGPDSAAAAAAPPSGDDQQQHAEGGTGGPHAAGQQPGAADGAAATDGQQQPDGAGGAPPAAQHPAAAAGGYVPVPEVVPDNTYMNRESRHMERERAGELTARYITNDGAIESGRLLIGLKNVFSKCLPNMPKEYICRLLFERRHKSVVIVRQPGNHVIGGITYRTFPGTPAARLGEIAFCAVAQTLQVTGYGTRLMNWTKHYAREMDGLEAFLTYADNNAVGYFSKQQFTKTITLEKEKWAGFIKDYDGGTLMECRIHPSLPYADFPGMLSKQRAALESEVKRYTTGHVVHPGLDHWKEGGGPLPVDQIPGVVEAGWTHAAGMLYRKYQIAMGGHILDPTEENLYDFMSMLLKKAQRHADAGPFLQPVSAEDVPDYYSIIIDPMDLGTMEQRLQSRTYYITLNMFAADFYKMVKNCQLYNGSTNPYFLAARRLYDQFWGVMRSSILPSLEAAGIVEPKL